MNASPISLEITFSGIKRPMEVTICQDTPSALSALTAISAMQEKKRKESGNVLTKEYVTACIYQKMLEQNPGTSQKTATEMMSLIQKMCTNYEEKHPDSAKKIQAALQKAFEF